MYKYATIDIETTDLNRFKGEITYIGVGLSEEIGQPIKKTLIYELPFTAQTLKKFTTLVGNLKKNKVKCVWQNGKFDTLWIEYKLGMVLPISHDVMLLGTCYDLAEKHGLKDMAKRYLGVTNWDIAKKDKTSKSDKTKEYLSYDVRYTWELFCYFFERLTSQQWRHYNELLRPAYLMYRRVERTGVYFDMDKFVRVKADYAEKAKEKLIALNKRHDINWNSPQQVQKALFEKDKLPVIKLTGKGVPSADAKVLRRLAAKGYDLPVLLLEYKFYYGANSKFLNTWDKYAQYDGRIHPSFNITNVVTGRTSCSDPNLQQVPRNPELRSLYTAPPGRVLIEADYSQIELRVAADYANEPTMIQIYKTGGDIHTETAKIVSGKLEPTKEDRSKAKAVNFGFLYGMQYKTFVDYAFDSYGVIFTTEEAKRIRELFFIKYSRLLPWHKEMEQLCELLGGVENRFGRFRKLPDIYSRDYGERSAAARRAINMPVQSTASDMLIGAAVEIDKNLSKRYDAKIVGTVHDSILIDCPEEYSDIVCKRIKEIMSEPQLLRDFNVTFKVPIEADIGIGAWGSK